MNAIDLGAELGATTSIFPSDRRTKEFLDAQGFKVERGPAGVETAFRATLEEVAEAPSGFRWFQLYFHRDSGVTQELVKRAEAAGYRAIVVTADPSRCLLIYPKSAWEPIQSRLMALSSFNAQIRGLQRLLVGHADDVEMDAAGRILIPPDLREKAGLSKEVTLVGGGLPQFELWDRARFEEYERTRADRLPSLFERLSGLGV